jgi:hypothetical protein
LPAFFFVDTQISINHKSRIAPINLKYFIEIRKRAEKNLSSIPKTDAQMKKEFAVIPYKDFLRMQEELEDYRDLCDPRNQEGRPFHAVAEDLGLKKKIRPSCRNAIVSPALTNVRTL